MCHILVYPDSYLHYKYKQDKDFNMMQLIMFDSPEWKSVDNPVNWLISIGGSDGSLNCSRRIEMFKEICSLNIHKD